VRHLGVSTLRKHFKAEIATGAVKLKALAGHGAASSQ
jgi:hypothetical protein